MMKFAALWLCIGFTLFLFIIDRQKKGGGSLARWLIVAYVAMIATRAVSSWFNLGIEVVSPDDYLEGSPFDRNIFIGFLVLAVVAIFRRRVNWEWVQRNNKLIILFFLYAAFSVLWSDYALVSFKRWVKGAGLLVMVMLLLTEDDPVEALRWVFRKTAILLIPISIVLIKYFPEFGRSYTVSGGQQFTGVTGNKNMLGALCFVYGVFFVWDLLAVRRGTVERGSNTLLVNILILAMIAYLFRKADSATSLVCFILGTAIVLILELSEMKQNIGRFGVFLAIVLLLFGTLEALFGLSEAVITALGRDMTFTGRVDIWSDAISMARNPLVGSGYESFWLGDRAQRMWDVYSSRLNQAHNGYIEIYLNLGIIGLVLLSLMILTGYKNILLRIMSGDPIGSLRMALFLTALLYNFSEAAFKTGLIWFVFFFCCLDYQPKQAVQAQPLAKRIRRVPACRLAGTAGGRR
ncbi:MAG: hypothetical protein CVU64_07045 [Deltaproteobacteria bacterium HGW-Deltaproteobacteria-21]|nr:MAG: hypothetical protein CVU64_07045 [Deltaproteobacteria bacterium HGW-Deltaproteobacteria-21]